MPDPFDNLYDDGDPSVCSFCEWRCPECGECMCDDESGCRPCFGCGRSQCECECEAEDLFDADDDETQ